MTPLCEHCGRDHDADLAELAKPAIGRKCCGCIDDEAHKYGECFCLCHTANHQSKA